MGGKQRYMYKSCAYRYTVDQKGFSSDTKRQAIVLYLHGLDFRSIARILHCSHTAVHNWIKPYSKEIEEIRSEIGVEWVNIGQLKKYIATKKKGTKTALLLINLEEGAPARLCVSETDLKGM